MLAAALLNAGRAAQALEVYVALHNDAAIDAVVRKQSAESAVDVVAGALSFAEAEDLWDDIKSDSEWAIVQPALGYKLAKIYFHMRDFEKSEDMLELVVSKWHGTDFGKLAGEFLKRLRLREQIAPNRVGVVLPLSGKFQQYGERSLAAVKLALAKTGIEVVVKDSQGDPNIAANAVEELVMNDHVMAIIGELFSKSAMAAALKAEELSVPMLSLSHQEGLPQLGPYVFRTALTVEAQAQALARTAFEELGMSRFALLYPRSKYGTDFANAFWAEVDRRKGEIRGVESYEHDQTTFREEVRKLVGRWYLMARPEYVEKQRQIKNQSLPPHREKKAFEDLEKEQAPIVDFDAIVIPDSGRNIGLIVPALLVEDIVLTRDPKELKTIEKATGRKDLKPVTLLGASTWNTPQTVESCERYCEHAVFVDGYFPDNPDPRVRDFVSAFKEATGAVPLLSEAQAYDTAGVLAEVLASQPPDRRTLRDRLQKHSSYLGVTGPLRFDADGEAQRALFTLTIKEREIRLWSKDLEPPQG